MDSFIRLLADLDKTLLRCLNVGEPPSHVHLLRAEIVEGRARIDALLLTGGWLPIETAPKDRDMILTDGKTVCQGGWISDLDQGAEYEGQIGMAGFWSVGGIEAPTHWMPLPLPPLPEAK